MTCTSSTRCAREQATMEFIQNSFLIAGLILSVLVGAIAWW